MILYFFKQGMYGVLYESVLFVFKERVEQRLLDYVLLVKLLVRGYSFLEDEKIFFFYKGDSVFLSYGVLCFWDGIYLKKVFVCVIVL